MNQKEKFAALEKAARENDFAAVHAALYGDVWETVICIAFMTLFKIYVAVKK